MKQFFLFFLLALGCSSLTAQQINGVFTDFAKNVEWANTGINTATQEVSGYITLGGFYEGRSAEKKMPLLMQINAAGAIRTDFGGGGAALLSFISSSQGNTEIRKTFLANNSTLANSQQFIISGRQAVNDGFASDGFMLKMFGNGSRPTAFNGGNISFYSGGAGSARGFIEDWVTGSYVYSVRLNGATFTQVKVVLSAFHKDTGAPLASFGDNGTVRINPPEDFVVDQACPVRIIVPPGGTHSNKFYVAFSVVPVLGPTTSIAVCRLNTVGGGIDSTYGTNGYKTFPLNSRYYITSLLANNDESITVGGYGADGMASIPSFHTFKADGSTVISSYNYLLGEPNPGYGSKNMGAKKATINGQERIVFTYAHPINTNGEYRIAIASLSPANGAGGDPLVHTPWLGSGFLSAEPTSIITLSGNAGFIVTGKATRNNGSIAGIVLKYTTNGTLDPAFADNGVLIVNGRTGGGQWNFASQLSTDKYLAAGGAEFVSGDPGKKAILLSRFHSDGSIDSSFGTNGSLYSLKSDNPRSAHEIVPLPNGEFLVSGTYFSTTNEPGTLGGSAGNEAILCKYQADGSLDYSFGPFNNGRFHANATNLGYTRVIGDHIFAAAHPSGAVLKLSSGGNLVSTYATGLALVQDYVVNESTGFLYAGGSRNQVTAKQVVKITAGGSVDATFGTAGYVSIPIISSGDNVNVNQLMQRPDGSLLAVMNWNSPFPHYGIFFSSISDAGVLDMSFGTNAAKFLQLPGATDMAASRYKWIGENNNRRLMIFGQAMVNSVWKGFVCKVDMNGDLDVEFGNNGVIWTTETFAGTVGFDNSGNALAIKDYGFFHGETVAKVSIPADVYNHIKPGSWTGAIDNDWFKPGNWAEGLVPDAYTAVSITNGSVLIGAGLHAFAWSIDVANTASLTLGSNSSLELTEHNP